MVAPQVFEPRTSVHETSSFTLAMKWSSKCVSPLFSKAFRRLCYMPDDTNTSIRIPLLFSGTSNIYVSIYQYFQRIVLKNLWKSRRKMTSRKKKTNKQTNKQETKYATPYSLYTFCFFVFLFVLFFTSFKLNVLTEDWT